MRDGFIKNIEKLLPAVDEEVNDLIRYIEQNKREYLTRKDLNDLDSKKYVAEFDKKIEYNLDFLMTPFTKKPFYKVLYYWGELNPDSEKDYRKIFKEFYEE